MQYHWPVSHVSYVLCGFAQVIPPLVFFFFEAIDIFGSYMVFDYALKFGHIGYAVFLTYLAFMVVPLVKATIGIVGEMGNTGCGET
jgi:hypothetical protein